MKRYRKSAVIFAMALFALLVLPLRSPAAGPAGGEAPGPAKMEAKSGCPCDCACDACGKECACGHKRGVDGKHPRMEGMKNHMEEVRRSVAALREHEKKLEGITDPADFRKAAIEHFRMLDDLNESHVKHMDSMMGGGHEYHHH
ncbi:MAG: hypothetical protein ACXW4G_06780 [Candidatus Deferrimicrobiaceae bacterium]